MAEQRYEAVRAVLADGETVTDVVARFSVARKTVHVWLGKYEAGGLEGLGDGSHRPRSCPHQMPAAVEVALVELRLAHRSWGPRRLRREDSAAVRTLRPSVDGPARPSTVRGDGYWVARRASAVGVVCVNWQQVCLGAAAAGHSIDVWVTEHVLQFYDGDHLLRTQQREQPGEVRKKRASIPGGRSTLKTSGTDQPR